MKDFTKELEALGYKQVIQVDNSIEVIPGDLRDEKKRFAAMNVQGLEKATMRLFSAYPSSVLIISFPQEKKPEKKS